MGSGSVGQEVHGCGVPEISRGQRNLPEIQVHGGTRRTVFITPRFARRQAEIAYDVLFFCRPSTRSSNWTHVRERDEFMHAVQRATVARKPTQVTVFGEPEDRWDDVGSVRLFYERGDLPKLLRLDRALSWVGLGAAEWQEHSWQ